MSYKGIGKRINIFIKNQIILFLFQLILLVIIFPLVIYAIYSPSEFRMDLSIYKLVQVVAILMAGFYEIEVLKNWYGGKNSEIMWFYDKKPWIYAAFFNLIYCFEILSGITIINYLGIKIKYEWIDVIGLCMMSQLAGAITVKNCKDEVIGKILSVVAVIIGSFYSRSSFFWQNEFRDTVEIKKVVIFLAICLALWILTIADNNLLAKRNSFRYNVTDRS